MPTAPFKNVVDRLSHEDIAERRRGGRRAKILAHTLDLIEHIGQAIAGIDRGEPALNPRNQTGRHTLDRSKQRNVSGQGRRQRRVRKECAIKQLCNFPENALVDPRLETETVDGLAEQLGTRPMTRHGKRVGGNRNRVGARACCLEGNCERRAARTLRIEANWDSSGISQRGNQCTRPRRVERARRVEQQQAIGTELGQRGRTVNQALCTVGMIVVDETKMQARAGLAHSLSRPNEILRIVHRIVHAEDRNARLSGTVDETTNQILLNRLRTDEEAPAQSHAQWCLGGALFEVANALPRTLDATIDGAIETATARHLKDVKTGAVEQLAGLKLKRGWDATGARFLRQKAQRGVDETSHQKQRVAIRQAERLRARHVTTLAGVDFDRVALVDEERNLNNGAGFERGGLHHVRDGVAFDTGLRGSHDQLDRGRQLQRGRVVVDRQELHRVALLQPLQVVGADCTRQRDLLERLGIHHHDFRAVVVEELHVGDGGEDARKLFASAEGSIDDSTCAEHLQLGAHKRATLTGLDVLKLDDPIDRAFDIDVHAVLELVRRNVFSHVGEGSGPTLLWGQTPKQS